MSGPTYANAGAEVTGTGVSCTPGLPSGLNTGDLVIAQVYTSTSSTVNTPSGWTLIKRGYISDAVGYYALFYQVYAGGSAPTFTWSGSQDYDAITYRYVGASVVSPIGAVGSVSNGTADPVTSSAITTTANNSLAVMVAFTYGGTGANIDIPSGWSESFDNYTSIDLSELALFGMAIPTSGTSSGATSGSDPGEVGWITVQFEIKANVPDNVSLATTEATDTASLSLSASTNVSLSTTEATDTASISIGVISAISLSTTEVTDTVRANVVNIAGVSLHIVTTEVTDTASIVSGVGTTISLATTEVTDTASILVSVINPLLDLFFLLFP